MIQADIFRALSAKDVRGLIRHEVLYKMFVENPFRWEERAVTELGNSYYQTLSTEPRDSGSTRYAHQVLASKNLSKLTFNDYALAVKATNNWLKKGNIALDLRTLKPLTSGAFLVQTHTEFEGTPNFSWVVIREDGTIDVELTQRHGSFQAVFNIKQNSLSGLANLGSVRITDDAGLSEVLQANFEYGNPSSYYNFSTTKMIPFGTFG